MCLHCNTECHVLSKHQAVICWGVSGVNPQPGCQTKCSPANKQRIPSESHKDSLFLSLGALGLPSLNWCSYCLSGGPGAAAVRSTAPMATWAEIDDILPSTSTTLWERPPPSNESAPFTKAELRGIMSEKKLPKLKTSKQRSKANLSHFPLSSLSALL